MRSNRSLVAIAIALIVVVIIAGAAYLYFTQGVEGITGLFGGNVETPVEATPIPTPVPMRRIVVSAQTITRGTQITIEGEAEVPAVVVRDWPVEALPVAFYSEEDMPDLQGKYARMDIPRGMPVLPDMIGTPGGMLAVNGSSAALFTPEDRVAYAIPMDTQGAVAWAVRPGDRVDVIAALQMQTASEFSGTDIKAFTVLPDGGENSAAASGVYGEFEILPNGQLAAIYPANQGQFSNFAPALLVQMTVQDAVVWHVGEWSYDEETAIQPVTDETVDGAPVEETAVPTGVSYRDIEPITLLVTRQDALVLKYLHEMGADLDLVLRPINVEGPVIQTQPVWFRYILDNYNMPNEMPDDPVTPAELRAPLDLLPQVTPAPEN